MTQSQRRYTDVVLRQSVHCPLLSDVNILD
nr:MAG TPA: hypothetical protein [Caudoviricetes sp.]